MSKIFVKIICRIRQALRLRKEKIEDAKLIKSGSSETIGRYAKSVSMTSQ